MVQPPWRKIWQYLTKLHKHLPFDPENSFLGIYPRDIQEKYEKTYAQGYLVDTIYSGKNWKELKCSSMGD